MTNFMKKRCNFPPGTPLQGKWHGNCYTIVKKLGSGANGIVYLVQAKRGLAALKMSDNSATIISEVNVLKSFRKVQGFVFGPSLLDVDDWVFKQETIHFYVMEYIKGTDLLQFIQQRGPSWTVVLVLQLLGDLRHLHDNGWVFGDLKPENLIISGPPPRVRCVDVGGTTLQGRAVKEFTEFFDRGYWGLGSRKADPKYDLFAVAMIMMNVAYPERFRKEQGGIEQLRHACHQKEELKMFRPIIIKALKGMYATAEDMRTDLVRTTLPKREHRKQQSIVQMGNHLGKTKNQSKGRDFLETVVILAVVSAVYLIYLLGQVL